MRDSGVSFGSISRPTPGHRLEVSRGKHGFLFCAVCFVSRVCSERVCLPMPPFVIDLKKAEDPRDVVYRTVQALAEGCVVALPTETDYVVAASILNHRAVAILTELSSCEKDQPRLSLVVKSAEEALDWAPAMSSLGRRLARRCWPGPVAMLVNDNHPESLLHQLPHQTQTSIEFMGRLRLRSPTHRMLNESMRMLVGPVVLAEPCGDGVAVTIEDLLARAGSQISLAIDDGRTRYAQAESTISISEKDFQVVRAGVVSEDSLRRLSSVMVLFVCTGNTCRSPMAESLFRMLVSERLHCRPDELHQRGIITSSAGISAWGGGKASNGALEAMRNAGADLTGHESQPLTENLVRQADLIWTMTASHRAAIIAQFPEASDRVSMLSPDRIDVVDPIGGPVSVYRKCAEQIRGHLEGRIDTLGL